MCSGHVVSLRFDLVSDHVDLVSDHVDLVSDHVAAPLADLVTRRTVEGLDEAVRHAFRGRPQQSLNDQRVQRLPGLGAGPAGNRLRVRDRRAATPAREGEQPRPRLVQPHAEPRLQPALLLVQQLLAHEVQLERLLRPVVRNLRRNVAEPLPAPEDGAHPGARLLTEANPAERVDDGRVAHLLLGRVQQFVGGGEGVARIPEHRPVPEEADRRLAAPVAVVLVDQQVDRGFPEGNVIGRIVVPLQRLRVQTEGVFRVLREALRENEPRLNQVLLDHDAVEPALVRGPGVVLGGDELAVDDRPPQRSAQVARTAEQQDRRPDGDEPLAPLDDESPLVEELHWRRRGDRARTTLVEPSPIPVQRRRVVERLGRQAVDRLRVVPLRRGVAEKPLNLVDRAAFVTPAAPDERPADIAVEADRLLVPRRLRHVEHQQRLAVDLDRVLADVDRAVHLAGPQRAQELTLHLVHFVDADGLERAAVVADAEHQPAAGRVGEGRHRLVRRLRRRRARLLELDVRPLPAIQPVDHLLPGHRRSAPFAITPGHAHRRVSWS